MHRESQNPHSFWAQASLLNGMGAETPFCLESFFLLYFNSQFQYILIFCRHMSPPESFSGLNAKNIYGNLIFLSSQEIYSSFKKKNKEKEKKEKKKKSQLEQ